MRKALRVIDKTQTKTALNTEAASAGRAVRQSSGANNLVTARSDYNTATATTEGADSLHLVSGLHRFAGNEGSNRAARYTFAAGDTGGINNWLVAQHTNFSADPAEGKVNTAVPLDLFTGPDTDPAEHTFIHIPQVVGV